MQDPRSYANRSTGKKLRWRYGIFGTIFSCCPPAPTNCWKTRIRKSIGIIRNWKSKSDGKRVVGLFRQFSKRQVLCLNGRWLLIGMASCYELNVKTFRCREILLLMWFILFAKHFKWKVGTHIRLPTFLFYSIINILNLNCSILKMVMIRFPSHHPRHPFLRLDELVPIEPLVQFSERFAPVALDAVLGRQYLERRSDLRERNLYWSEKQTLGLVSPSPNRYL